ncbi:MAG: aspartate--ammonia ligase, partial [Anaerovoracaceae bacterium]
KYGVEVGQGIYTDMNAIRRDEDLDNIHSIYVDQWDWEKVIQKSDRTEEYLNEVVNRIYSVLKGLATFVNENYAEISHSLPEEIFFISSQDLENRYPNMTSKEREFAITEEKRAVFISKIGGTLNSGAAHDGRAPDYDDWELNGDILLWDEVLEIALEISSMGIRVDEGAMEKQLKIRNSEDRMQLDFHKKIMNKELPYTIGGGIGQSRLCMYFLKKAHIGEVQVSVWPEEMIKECKENRILIL